MSRWSTIGTAGVLLVGGALALTVVVLLSLERLVRTGIERIGSEQAKVAVTVRDVRISLLQGRARIEGLTVANPSGYQRPVALSVRSIAAGWDWRSLSSNRIVLTEMIIDGPELNFEGSWSDNNLETIRKNLNGSARVETRHDPDSGAGTNRYVVRRLSIIDTRVNLRLRTGSFQSSAEGIRLRPITLEHLGDPSHPLSTADLAAKVFDALTQEAVGSIGKTAGGVVEKSAEDAGKAVGRAVDGFKRLFSK
ncbi:hypothetical protein YTPLAS18_38840 [Nitrospira sp.]|nr:hypothetical protein YTPLAS18_38840 [Nitrospira sp.]